jgi:hypothetical protein
VQLDQDKLQGMVEARMVFKSGSSMQITWIWCYAPEGTALGEAKKVFIWENMNVTVPDEYKNRYAELILKHHDVVSQNKHDLGRCETMLHDICLKSNEPIYVS